MAEMEKKYEELKNRLSEIYDLDMIGALLNWDQSTYMPAGGAEARGRQSALLTRLSMERSVDPEIGRLLDALRPYEESLPFDSDEASLIRVARRDYEHLVKVPPAFMSELTEHQSRGYMTWAEARPANDFRKVQPSLEKPLDYSRKLADFFPGYEHIADPLIDFADYGMKASSVRALFAELREKTVPIVKAITSQPPADDSCLRKHFPEDGQLKFGAETVKQMGFNFERGRLDRTPHPFTT